MTPSHATSTGKSCFEKCSSSPLLMIPKKASIGKKRFSLQSN
jgi:hypothetical protein